VGGLREDVVAMTDPEKSIATGIIISNREIFKDHFLMILRVPADFRASVPGQFVMLRREEGDHPFLGRPFSIHSLYSMNGETVMEILYRISGRGTALIARLTADDRVTILGPLGRGFDVPVGKKKIVLVAGGMGIAPLFYLAEYCLEERRDESGETVLYFGAQSSHHLFGLDRLERLCSSLKLSTDDGTLGYHGPVTDLVAGDALSFERNDSALFACGPYGMIKEMARIAGKFSIPCQVSVEEKMACGIGACLGCAVRASGENTSKRFMRVCKEGPVFDTREIDWNWREG
jgi:dihydroorotate dehydrogenase electron transfer subunit